jgi:hypothetical protein
VRHPDYPLREQELDYDIMVVKLDAPAESSRPIIQMNYDPDRPGSSGEVLTMMGFGATSQPINGQLNNPLTLQEATTQYVTNDDCSTACDPVSGNCFGTSPTNTLVDPHWFCTIQTEPIQTGTCFGDSGTF